MKITKKIINNIIWKDKYSKNQVSSHCHNIAHLGFNTDEEDGIVCPECGKII